MLLLNAIGNGMLYLNGTKIMKREKKETRIILLLIDRMTHHDTHTHTNIKINRKQWIKNETCKRRRFVKLK